MTPRGTTDPDVSSLDDLELELRKLPGVRAAGFEERDDMLLVQLHVAGRTERADAPVPVSASRIAARHSDRPVVVEVVRWRSMVPTPPAASRASRGAAEGDEGPDAGDAATVAQRHRARLLAVLSFPETDELEVHLILDGRRTIGRAAASAGLVGAVQATIDAVRELGAPFDPHAKWARALDDTVDEERVVVAVALENVDDEMRLHYGLAAGTSPIDAAARSTLDALNRRLSRLL